MGLGKPSPSPDGYKRSKGSFYKETKWKSDGRVADGVVVLTMGAQAERVRREGLLLKESF